MEKTIDSLSSSQKYSVVKNEDFEETSLEESGGGRAALSLANHKSYQSAWYTAVKFLICREVLAVHLTWLLVLTLSILCLRVTTYDVICANSRLPSDEVFGKSAFHHSYRGHSTLLNFQKYHIELSVGRKTKVSSIRIQWMGSVGI